VLDAAARIAMRLIVQPDDGLGPLLKAIEKARSSIDLTIFRFDLRELEQALAAAVARGVVVRALVAHTNKNGEGKLRALEDRLLGYGVTIDRTPDDLVRYHGKLLIVDKRHLFVLGFNYTKLDMLKSRSFGIMLTNKTIAREVEALLAADANRHSFTPRSPSLVVSPDNARQRLTRLIRQAKKELRIYDPNVSDDAMASLLKARAEDGLQVRILGTLEKKWRSDHILVEQCPLKRLHVRAIIADGSRAFVGSQSLRRIELDERREVGVIVKAPAIVSALARIFEADWTEAAG
jgi:cardiolipin synthase